MKTFTFAKCLKIFVLKQFWNKIVVCRNIVYNIKCPFTPNQNFLKNNQKTLALIFVIC